LALVLIIGFYCKLWWCISSCWI